MGGGPGGQRGSLCGSGGGAESGMTGWAVYTVTCRGIAAAADVELAVLVNGAEP